MPNLYPALERQEVVVHGPSHTRSLADLGDTTLDLIAQAWQRRAHDTVGTVFPFINEGHGAGASLPHSHSQLAWLPTVPPAILAERGLPPVEPILERDGLIAGCPTASRTPYEVQVAPERSEPEGLRSDLLGAGLRLLAELVRRLREIHGSELEFNAWLHDGVHWHLELVPRLTRIAGLELGAGVWVNSVAPEDAAAAYRRFDEPDRSV